VGSRLGRPPSNEPARAQAHSLAQGIQSRQLDAQHLLIQKQQGGKRLVLGAGRDVAPDRQVGEEAFDLGRPHGVGVAEVVKADEALGPGGVAVRGAGRELADTAGPADAVEQAWRLGAGQLAHVQTEDVVVKERQRAVGLGEAVERILLGVGDVLEEAADITWLEFAGMAFVMEQDQGAGPVGVAFRGAVLAETLAGELTDEIQKPRGLRGGREWGRRSGHGGPPKGNVGGLGECTPEQKRGQEKKGPPPILRLTEKGGRRGMPD
jgi:hypothetical protein